MAPYYFSCTNPETGEFVMGIRLDGSIEFGPGYTADKAYKEGARRFGEFVHAVMSGAVCTTPPSTTVN